MYKKLYCSYRIFIINRTIIFLQFEFGLINKNYSPLLVETGVLFVGLGTKEPLSSDHLLTVHEQI